MKLIKACWFSIPLMCASFTCAQELGKLDKPSSVATTWAGTADLGAQQKAYPLSTRTIASSAIRQTRGNEGMLARISKEYSNKPPAAMARETEKNIILANSNFSLHYSPDGDHAALEYRFSEHGALRLHGAHRGVKIVAAWKY